MCYLHISIPTFLTCLCLAGHVCLHALRSAFNMKHWWKKGDDSGFGGNVWRFIALKIDIDTRTYIWIIKHFLFKQLHVFIGSHFHAEKHTCRYQPVHHIHSHSSTFWEKVFLDLTCVLMLLLISVHLCIGQKASFWIMDKIRIAFPWTFC